MDNTVDYTTRIAEGAKGQLDISATRVTMYGSLWVKQYIQDITGAGKNGKVIINNYLQAYKMGGGDGLAWVATGDHFVHFAWVNNKLDVYIDTTRIGSMVVQ